jgi:multidrug efflux pump subunit AcrA (membrane-fusion protein)
MMSHHNLHARLVAREQELLEKRAYYEAQIDEALAAARAARAAKKAQAASARPRPERQIGAIRPMRWLRLRLAQS